MGAFLKYPELVEWNKHPEILAVKQVIATEKLHGTHFRLFFPAHMASIAETSAIYRQWRPLPELTSCAAASSTRSDG